MRNSSSTVGRQREFDSIAKALRTGLRFSTRDALVIEGDALQALRSMPAASVSLILTDPPYHVTKKRNIYGDAAFTEDQHYLEWMRQFALEWRRILRPNGSLLCFCDSSMCARLEVMLSKPFNILSHIVWTKPNDPGFDGWKGKMKKEALRQWYPHSERMIFAEPAVEGNLHRSPFAQFLRDVRKQSGLTAHELAEVTGAYGKVNHGGAVSNWETGRNIPSREQYLKVCRALLQTGRVAAMPPYENAIRVFRMDGSKEFTDVWTFPSVRPYKGKHPAEKPAAMLEHAIEATTLPGDIVMDCFAGSGSTAVAARKLRRRAVAIEIEPQWVRSIGMRLQADALKKGASGANESASPRQRQQPQLALFAGLK